MTLADLEREALESAARRGHDMSNFDEFLTSECRRCGLTVYVDEYPGPNDICLGGSALAIECEDPPARIPD